MYIIPVLASSAGLDRAEFQYVTANILPNYKNVNIRDL